MTTPRMTAEQRSEAVVDDLEAALRTTNGDSAWFFIIASAIRSAEVEAANEALEDAEDRLEKGGRHMFKAASVVRSLKRTPEAK